METSSSVTRWLFDFIPLRFKGSGNWAINDQQYGDLTINLMISRCRVWNFPRNILDYEFGYRLIYTTKLASLVAKLEFTNLAATLSRKILQSYNAVLFLVEYFCPVNQDYVAQSDRPIICLQRNLIMKMK
jgi:hypothetical protein